MFSERNANMRCVCDVTVSNVIKSDIPVQGTKVQGICMFLSNAAVQKGRKCCIGLLSILISSTFFLYFLKVFDPFIWVSRLKSQITLILCDYFISSVSSYFARRYWSDAWEYKLNNYHYLSWLDTMHDHSSVSSRPLTCAIYSIEKPRRN